MANACMQWTEPSRQAAQPNEDIWPTLCQIRWDQGVEWGHRRRYFFARNGKQTHCNVLDRHKIALKLPHWQAVQTIKWQSNGARTDG